MEVKAEGTTKSKRESKNAASRANPTALILEELSIDTAIGLRTIAQGADRVKNTILNNIKKSMALVTAGGVAALEVYAPGAIVSTGSSALALSSSAASSAGALLSSAGALLAVSAPYALYTLITAGAVGVGVSGLGFLQRVKDFSVFKASVGLTKLSDKILQVRTGCVEWLRDEASKEADRLRQKSINGVSPLKLTMTQLERETLDSLWAELGVSLREGDTKRARVVSELLDAAPATFKLFRSRALDIAKKARKDGNFNAAVDQINDTFNHLADEFKTNILAAWRANKHLPLEDRTNAVKDRIATAKQLAENFQVEGLGKAREEAVKPEITAPAAASTEGAPALSATILEQKLEEFRACFSDSPTIDYRILQLVKQATNDTRRTDNLVTTLRQNLAGEKVTLPDSTEGSPALEALKRASIPAGRDIPHFSDLGKLLEDRYPEDVTWNDKEILIQQGENVIQLQLRDPGDPASAGKVRIFYGKEAEPKGSLWNDDVVKLVEQFITKKEYPKLEKAGPVKDRVIAEIKRAPGTEPQINTEEASPRQPTVDENVTAPPDNESSTRNLITSQEESPKVEAKTKPAPHTSNFADQVSAASQSQTFVGPINLVWEE